MQIQIVIVEDEPAIARGINEIITKYSKDCLVTGIFRNGQEALENITSDNPELVITDIRMPVMDGLEMIAQAKSQNCTSSFVILTGYGEFEYAKSALKLGVKDYLLKPIKPSELLQVLSNEKSTLEFDTDKTRSEYIHACVYGEKPGTVKKNAFQDCNITFFYLFYGSINSDYFNAFSVGSSLKKENSYDSLKQWEDKYNIHIYAYSGKHDNEYIYAFVSLIKQSERSHFFAEKLLEEKKSTNTFLNIVVSKTTDQPDELPEIIRDCEIYGEMFAEFGKDNICYSKKFNQNFNADITVQIKNVCQLIPEGPKSYLIEDTCKQMIEIWKNMHITQYQLLYDLRYVLEQAVQKSTSSISPHLNAEEIISEADSFDSLQEILKSTLYVIFEMKENGRNLLSVGLMDDVKEYLEKNFNRDITYKSFNDIFGYNEKYIALQFKEMFGISPSKYINQLKLERAKQLIRQYPHYSVQTIAEMSGFTDAFYFSRVFKNKEGISPSEYQKLQQK